MTDAAFIEKVKAMRLRGMSQEAIAVELRVSQGMISRILREHGLGGHLVKLKKVR